MQKGNAAFLRRAPERQFHVCIGGMTWFETCMQALKMHHSLNAIQQKADSASSYPFSTGFRLYSVARNEVLRFIEVAPWVGVEIQAIGVSASFLAGVCCSAKCSGQCTAGVQRVVLAFQAAGNASG